jgi:hypothetical protein
MMETSIALVPPTPETTIAVLPGASEYPQKAGVVESRAGRERAGDPRVSELVGRG